MPCPRSSLGERTKA